MDKKNYWVEALKFLIVVLLAASVFGIGMYYGVNDGVLIQYERDRVTIEGLIEKIDFEDAIDYYKSDTGVNCQCDMTCDTKICPIYEVAYDCADDGLFVTMKNVAGEIDYMIDIYDCTEFSNELNRRLLDKGYKSKTKFVRVDCDSGLFEESSCNAYDGGHQIVQLDRVYVEATSGKIIDPSLYESYGIR